MQAYLSDLCLVTSLDFDPIHPLLNSLYSPIKRRTPRDPHAMLRSLLLMTHHKLSSITDWVEQTRTQPLLAILAGFDPPATPGVGTSYDFLNRFIDGPYQPPCPPIVKRSTRNANKFLRNLPQDTVQKKDESDPTHPLSEQRVDELLPHASIPRPNNFYKLLEDLLLQLARKNHLKKNVYDVSKACRSADQLQVRLTLVDIVDHASLWYRNTRELLSRSQLFQACLEKLSRSRPPHPPAMTQPLSASEPSALIPPLDTG